MSNLDVLFSPYRLNALDLPNRVVMAPMTRSFSPGGVPTADVVAYYRRRAENGVGLIITEGTGIDRPSAFNEPDVPRFHGEAALAVSLDGLIARLERGEFDLVAVISLL